MFENLPTDRPVRGVTTAEALAEQHRLDRVKAEQQMQDTTPAAVAARAAKLPPPHDPTRPRFASMNWHG